MCLFVGKKQIRAFENLAHLKVSINSFFYFLGIRSDIGGSSSLIACLAPQVDAFCWLVVAGKVSEVDNGRRYMVSVEILDICFMCGKQGKPINHFF